MRKPILSLIALMTGSISLLAQPTITQQPTDQVATNGGTVLFSVTVSGTGPFTYQWQFNGTNLPNNTITTVAGNGTNAFSGDGGPATNASLYYPQGVALDAAGNLYIADNNNDRVRKVDTNGIIATVAGNGVGSVTNGGNFSGDGGSATNAGLYRPNNLAFDAVGNMYIADIFNNRVRKVDANAVITTVAGNGASDEYGDGSLATNAGLAWPASVAIDSEGNLLIDDLVFGRIRKVDNTGIISTVAGGGSGGDNGQATNASLNHPQGVAVDASGNFYIAEAGTGSPPLYGRVRRVDTNGIITTVAGGGSKLPSDGGAATNALLGQPWGVTLDAAGNIYFTDKHFDLVCKVDTNGVITTVAGKFPNSGYSGDGGAGTNASLNGPACVVLDVAGNLYIADWYNNRIREVHFAGFPSLTLNNVSLSNAGIYTVVVTSASGSVTSSNVTLSVVAPPNVSATIAADGTLNLTWSAQSNFIYQLQYTTNLAAPVWQNIGSSVTATNGTASASDIPGADAQRFYRVEWVP